MCLVTGCAVGEPFPRAIWTEICRVLLYSQPHHHSSQKNIIENEDNNVIMGKKGMIF